MTDAAVQTRRETRLQTQFRAADAAPTTYNADTHTVELTASAGARVKRWSWDGPWFEELDVAGVRLERVTAGQCPLLDTHSSWTIDDQLGAVRSARTEGGELIVSVAFSQSDRGMAVEQRVAAGELRGVSCGYRIHELEKVGEIDGVPILRAIDWELFEVSLVPVPADAQAGVRSVGDLHPCIIKETRAMKAETNTPATPATDPVVDETRAAPQTPAPATPAATPAVPDASAARMTAAEAIDFAADARAFGVEDTQARAWATDCTPETARSNLLRAAADKQRAQAPLNPAMSATRISVDERDTFRMAISSALLHRANPKNELHEAGREYRGMSLLEIARRNLEANGEKCGGLNKRELADLALRQHSTSDFPHVLSNVAGKTLRAGYEAAPQTFKQWQRRASVPDFKQVTRLQMGAAPSFLLVPEGGQFKMGTIGEGKEVYAIATYGRIFSVTRQVLINDDLDAFTRVPSMWGRAAADFESDAAYAPLIANPNMGDSVALFHATHGNLAGSGGAIAEGTLEAAEIAMGAQTGIEGRAINLSPRWLIVGRKDNVAAKKLMTTVTPAQASQVNVYANTFDIVVESRLNRSSGATPWYMAADADQVDTIEYAYLEGDDGVFLDERVGFEVDGIEYKARLDFGVKAIDYRGLYQNPGT